MDMTAIRSRHSSIRAKDLFEMRLIFEPATVALLDAFIAEQGLENDMSDTETGRHHHEIYLSDPRRTAPEKLKTVLRHPVRPRG